MFNEYELQDGVTEHLSHCLAFVNLSINRQGIEKLTRPLGIQKMHVALTVKCDSKMLSKYHVRIL